MFTKNNNKKEIEEKLTSLVQKVIIDPNIHPIELLNEIKELVKKGADLNKKISVIHLPESKNKKTLTYLLLMHIPNFKFAQEIFDLGGDPRILNDDKTNLFMKPPHGRGLFTQTCWLDYINSNFDLDMRSTNYRYVIKGVLLIYYFCTMKEIQELHRFSIPQKKFTKEGLEIYTKIDYYEKHISDEQINEIQKIQDKFLFYSTQFTDSSLKIVFEVLPKDYNKKARIRCP